MQIGSGGRAGRTPLKKPPSDSTAFIFNLNFKLLSVHFREGTDIREIPDYPLCPSDDKWPCHKALLDHGSIGASGSNFVEMVPDEDCQFLHVTGWDPVHQDIRNGKNTVSKSWKGKSQDIMCTSSYVWSLNFKPYHSKLWAKRKAELLNGWLSNHDIHSASFQKRVSKMAFGFGMYDYDGSEAHMIAVFDKLYELKSFLESGQASPDTTLKQQGTPLIQIELDF